MKYFYYADVVSMSGDGRSGVGRPVVKKATIITEPERSFFESIVLDFCSSYLIASDIARKLNLNAAATL